MLKLVLALLGSFLVAGCAGNSYEYTSVEKRVWLHGRIQSVSTSQYHDTSLVRFESGEVVWVDVSRHLLSHRELVRGREMSSKYIRTRSGKEFYSLCADVGRATEWCVPVIGYQK